MNSQAEPAGAIGCIRLPILRFLFFMVDKVRDIAIIGLLFEHQIVFRDRAGRLLDRIWRDVGPGLVFITRRQGRARSFHRPGAPSRLACGWPQPRYRDRGAPARILGAARRAHDRNARKVVETCLTSLAHAFGAACRPGILDCGADDGLAMLLWLRADGAAGASPDGVFRPYRTC